ncbi:hypothetical protein L2E82_05990 [Cichorium intybus]|uniref:Uncharacterized protein n=1 Tax=Cichorium intybus TaxID=13427 RepID=A0ACB9H8Q2_CICIN|nr:hypothetical protein L2E82_05990 [Cichorium intybus]
MRNWKKPTWNLKNSKPFKHKNRAIMGCCSAGAVRPSPGRGPCQVTNGSKEYKYKERVVNLLAIHEQAALVRELCSNLPGLGKGSTGDKPHREVDRLSTSMVRIDPFFLAIETWGITYSD